MCSGEPLSVSLCHCASCQRRTGSAFGVAAFYPCDAVQIEGLSSVYVRQSDSGFAVTFRFCPACGGSVIWQTARKPDVMAVAAGAFADPGFPGPSQQVHLQSRQTWLDGSLNLISAKGK